MGRRTIPMILKAHYLTAQQLAALERISKKTGLNISELIRRAVDAMLEAGKK